MVASSCDLNMANAWAAGGSSLAQKLRAQPPPAEVKTASTAAATQHSQPAVVHHHAWYHPSDAHGAAYEPKLVRLGDNTLFVVAILVMHDGRVVLERELLSDGSEIEDLPSEELLPHESIADGAIRVAKSHLHVEFTPKHIVSVEHYPSLKQSWFRVLVHGDVQHDASNPAPDFTSAAPLESLLDGSRTVETNELIDLMRPYHMALSSRQNSTESKALSSAPSLAPLITPAADVGFAYSLVEVALVHGGKVLLVQRQHALGDASSTSTGAFWTLPQTHIDKGESVGFTASRLLRSSFGYVLDPDAAKKGLTQTEVDSKKPDAVSAGLGTRVGVASIHVCSHQDKRKHQIEGFKFTVSVHCDDELLPVDPTFTGRKDAITRWFSSQELGGSSGDEIPLRSDLQTMLARLLATPLSVATLSHI